MNRQVAQLGQRITETGAAIGRGAGDIVSSLQPQLRSRVNPPGVTPRVERPSDLAIGASSILPAIAETIPTEVSKFLTPQSLALQVAAGGALRGFAGTQAGQFPVERLVPSGRIREAIRRFGAPQIFAPITKPRGARPVPEGPIIEAQFRPVTEGVPRSRALVPVRPTAAAPVRAAQPSAVPAVRQKGPGFIGTLNRPGGGISTEISIGVKINGVETQIPTLVPTLTQNEIDLLLSGKRPTPQIVAKAVAHANGRTLQGKDPFAQAGETPTVPATRVTIKPFVTARRQAVASVTRELREQADILTQTSIRLRKAVIEAGGIRPEVGGGLREELSALPRTFLRRKGQPIDQLATELQFESGEQLREALLATAGVRRPNLTQLRREAEQIIGSESGSRIIEIIQQPGTTKQAIQRVVSDITRQVSQELQAGSKQVRGLLSLAQREALTPAQVARFSRLQREQPGQTQVGPRGGLREAPLGQADIQRIVAAGGTIVPRQPQITGQPPRIPRGKQLVPADFAQHEFRDLTSFQAAPTSGLDPIRASRLIDGMVDGPVRTKIIDPVRSARRASRAENREILDRLDRTVPRLKSRSQESQDLFDLIEGKLPAQQITPRLQQAAAEMRTTYDDLLVRINAIRRSQGKVEIQRRENYITHIQTLNLLDEFYYGLLNVPDDAIILPNLTTRPNAPFFQFALKRLGGPHARDAVEAYKRYVGKATGVIHHSPALQATRPLIDFVPSKAQGYLHQYLDEVLALKQPKADVLFPRPLISANNWLRRQMGGGAILGNFSSVFNQMWTLPATVTQVGPVFTVKAGLKLTAGTAKDIVNGIVRRVGPRDYARAAIRFQRPDIRDFIRQNSQLLQNRRFEIDFDPRTLNTMDKTLGKMIELVDQEMVSLAWLGEYMKQTRTTSGRPGASHAQAVRMAEDAAFRTQSGYTPEDLPPAFRSSIGGSVLQFQNSLNGVFNFLRFDVGLMPTRLLPGPKPTAIIRMRQLPDGTWEHTSQSSAETFKMALQFFASVLSIRMVFEHAGIPSAVEDPMDLVPLWGMAEFGPPAAWSGPAALVMLIAADTPQERARATGALKRASFLMLGRGGNQLRKTLDGITAISQGGRFSKDGRLLFPVTGTLEQSRAILFGPYGTKAGRAFIRRGFTPQPRTPVQRAVQKEIQRVKQGLLR